MKAINLQKIVSVKGKSGLFHLTNYNPKGYFLQPFEGGPIRFFSNEKGKVLALGNCDLKLNNQGSINLLEVFKVMEKEQTSNIGSSNESITFYFHNLIPELDQTIPPTNLKKVLSWYLIMEKSFGLKNITNEEVDGLTVV